MKKNRPVIVSAFIMSGLAVAGCSGAANGTSKPTASALNGSKPIDSLVVGIAGEGNTSSYGASVDRGLKDEATKLGMKVYFTEAQYDGTKQQSDVEDLIAKHPDGIAIVPVDSGLAAHLVDQITQANIPVAAVHTTVGTNFAPGYAYPGLTFLLGEDEIHSGYEDGKLAIQALPQGGQVAVVEGKAGYAAVNERLMGFKQAIAGHNITIVASQPGDWDQAKGQAVCANLMQAKPGIDLFFAQDDNMATGCAAAVKQSGSKVLVIGNGGSKAGIAAVRSGDMYGTVCTKPYTEGKLAMEKFAGVLSGQLKLDKRRVTYPTPGVTKENVSECIPEW